MFSIFDWKPMTGMILLDCLFNIIRIGFSPHISNKSDQHYGEIVKFPNNFYNYDFNGLLECTLGNNQIDYHIVDQGILLISNHKNESEKLTTLNALIIIIK
jgi:hypothetical protein